MQLKDIMRPECVIVPLRAEEKYQAITELIDRVNDAGLLEDYDKTLKAIMQREAIRSTGVGQGFAIPHGKTDGVDQLIMAVGKTARPIDFESIDKQPVDLIYLLVSPQEMTGPHIQALAKISRLMTDQTSRPIINKCQTPEELYRYIAEYGQ